MYVDTGLVDVSTELHELGLLLEWCDNKKGFVVRLVREGSAAAQCGRVKRGDVATEYNSVSIQSVQGSPAVRSHGVRPGKFAFLRLRKEDSSYVECAIERGDPAVPAQTRSMKGGSADVASNSHVLPNGTGVHTNGVSTNDLAHAHHSTAIASGAKRIPSAAEPILLSPSSQLSEICPTLVVDRSTRPPTAVDIRANNTGGEASIFGSVGGKGLGHMRWKSVGTANPGPMSPGNPGIFESSPTRKHGRCGEGGQNCATQGSEEHINLREALKRVEELSQENDLLRSQLRQHEEHQEAVLHAQREQMETNIEKLRKLAKEREASYERQIAALKEEAIDAKRRMQEMMGENEELQWMSQRVELQPSLAISRCLEALVLKILSVKPDFSDLICRDAYHMMYSWCFEKWLSPTLARNVAGGTRLLAREEMLKDGLLNCGAMEAMVKIVGSFSKENSEIESGAVEHAAASLANFSLKHPRSRAEVVNCGGMPALVKVLNGSTSLSMLEKACAAVSHIVCSAETKEAFINAGGIPALARLCSARSSMFGSERLLEEAARAFRNLAHGDDHICRQICAAGGIDALVQVCESSRDRAVITQSAAALANLACDEACRADLKKKYGWTKEFGAKKLAALENGERPLHSPAHLRGVASSMSPAPQARRPNSATSPMSRPKSAASLSRRSVATPLPARPRSVVAQASNADSNVDSDSSYVGVPPRRTRRGSDARSPDPSRGVSQSMSSGQIGSKTARQPQMPRSRTPDPKTPAKRVPYY